MIADTDFGVLEITINLAKPEKDPKAIAAAATNQRLKTSENTMAGIPTPRCDLCWENEEFPGTPDHPAKSGLRVAAIELAGETWGFQFSPYAYFDEHCIVLSKVHRPMKIDHKTIDCLLDFEDQFPFYMIGSNADLPIVGGSILSHDHYQGGRHVFPLMKAPLCEEFKLAHLSEVKAGVVKWPASVVRLRSSNRQQIACATKHIMDTWKAFSDADCFIIANDGTQHNTINPILHKEGNDYVFDLVLRNNVTTDDRPYGLFHPPEKLFHIKKENIGLIEIMGRAILPGRLAQELPAVQQILRIAAVAKENPSVVEEKLADDPLTAAHAAWAAEVLTRRAEDLVIEERIASAAISGVCLEEPSMDGDGFNEMIELKDRALIADPFAIGPVMRDEVGYVFAEVLEATGVFKHDAAGREGWKRFIASL